MEVQVDRDAFLKGLQMIHNVVEPRQTLPILANVLLESEGDTMRLTATGRVATTRTATRAAPRGRERRHTSTTAPAMAMLSTAYSGTW